MATRDLIDLVVLGAIWGASFLFMRVAVPQFGPVPLIAARVGIAAVFLVGVLARRGGVARLVTDAAPLTILGAVNSAIPFTLFAYAVLSVTAGFAAVLNSTAPLFGALVAFAWLHETPGGTRMLGLAVGFMGVLILVWDRLALSNDGSAGAVLAGLSAAVLYGISANYTKRRLSGVDPLVIATGCPSTTAGSPSTTNRACWAWRGWPRSCWCRPRWRCCGRRRSRGPAPCS